MERLIAFLKGLFMGRKPKQPKDTLVVSNVDHVNKVITWDKKEHVDSLVTIAEETNMKPNFTHRAVTLWYNTTNDTWNLVQVMIDPVTSSSGEMTVLMTDRHQSIVFEALKMELYKMVEN